MEMEEEKGISLGHLIKIAFRRWNLLLIVMAVVFVAGFILIQAFYNRGKVTYTTTFEYNVVGLSSGKYIDGDKFDYRDIISLDYLNEVKSSDNKYKSVNVEGMIENGDISITQIKATEDEKDPENLGYFKINVLARYFDNAKQAKEFLSALVNKPLDVTKTKLTTLDYYDNLELYENANILETKIAYLNAQLALLDSKYDSLIADYGDVLYNDSLISKYKSDQDLFFINNSLASLTTEIEENGYIIENTDYVNTLNASVYSLNKEKTANETKIAELQTKVDTLVAQLASQGVALQSAEITAYNTQIASLTTRNVDIDVELEIINRKLANLQLDSTTAEGSTYQANLAAFIIKINNYCSKLNEFTEQFVAIQKAIVTENCTIYYAKSSVVETNGGISVVISVVVSILVGLVVGCVVNLIVDRKLLNEDYYKKFIEEQKNKKEPEPKVE